MPTLPDAQIINHIVAGHYADPFSLLGMHQTDAGLRICAYECAHPLCVRVYACARACACVCVWYADT